MTSIVPPSLIVTVCLIARTMSRASPRIVRDAWRGLSCAPPRRSETPTEAAAVKIRAERRAGELLAERPTHLGGRPSENPSHDGRGFPALPSDNHRAEHRFRTRGLAPTVARGGAGAGGAPADP